MKSLFRLSDLAISALLAVVLLFIISSLSNSFDVINVTGLPHVLGTTLGVFQGIIFLPAFLIFGDAGSVPAFLAPIFFVPLFLVFTFIFWGIATVMGIILKQWNHLFIRHVPVFLLVLFFYALPTIIYTPSYLLTQCVNGGAVNTQFCVDGLLRNEYYKHPPWATPNVSLGIVNACLNLPTDRSVVITAGPSSNASAKPDKLPSKTSFQEYCMYRLASSLAATPPFLAKEFADASHFSYPMTGTTLQDISAVGSTNDAHIVLAGQMGLCKLFGSKTADPETQHRCLSFLIANTISEEQQKIGAQNTLCNAIASSTKPVDCQN